MNLFVMTSGSGIGIYEECEIIFIKMEKVFQFKDFLQYLNVLDLNVKLSYKILLIPSG